MSASIPEVKPFGRDMPGGSSQLHADNRSDAPTADVAVLFLTSFLPYPADHGGAMAREGFIRAIAGSARVSVLVLTSIRYDDELVRGAESYYHKFCESFECRQFPSLSPNGSFVSKAWDYLTGQPRNGFWSREAEELFVHQVKTTGCEVVWCDSVFNAKYLHRAQRMSCRTVLMTQNVESDLVRQAAARQRGLQRLKTRI